MMGLEQSIRSVAGSGARVVQHDAQESDVRRLEKHRSCVQATDPARPGSAVDRNDDTGSVDAGGPGCTASRGRLPPVPEAGRAASSAHALTSGIACDRCPENITAPRVSTLSSAPVRLAVNSWQAPDPPVSISATVRTLTGPDPGHYDRLQLLIGGILPALLCVAMLMLMTAWLAIRRGYPAPIAGRRGPNSGTT